MLLTDRRVARGRLVDVVSAAVAGGVRWVVLREKDLPRAERLALATELRPILARTGGTLIVAGPDPLLPDSTDALLPAGSDPLLPDGAADAPGPDTRGRATAVDRLPVALHLPAAGPYPPPAADLVGRSCHDAAELRRLTTEDYVTLSPVFPTRTKPGYGPQLLPEGLAELIRLSPVPAVALGGIETPAQVHACVEAGAAGVAVLGAIMRAENPHRTAATLTRAFREAATPKPPATATPERRTRHRRAGSTTTGLRPAVPTQGSSLTARSGHGPPQPCTAPTPQAQPQPDTATTTSEPDTATTTATEGET
ncbi:thiamine phosphate synthase [Micromonospora sp. CA-263727]|uniref:thiamine phosphate synthase n=1 Tax=Micromonospora sp. CA-263727 TaxID=3239967 RepID=UPI003D90BB97